MCVKADPLFDFVWSACLYEDPLKDLIHQFKYKQKTYLKYLFTDIMLSFFQTYNIHLNEFDFLMPIPLSSTSLRERGYNQSALLAECLHAFLEIPLCLDILIKARHTKHQVLLPEKERWTNIRGAFKIKRPQEIHKKSILIVDDLLTTGATACEAAGVLKESGAARVGILTLAITPSL